MGETDALFEIKDGTLTLYKGRGRRDIKTVTVPEGVKAIGCDAFYGAAIEEVCLPEGVESVGRGAFAGCMSLKKATLPSTLKEIGDDAFVQCLNLREIRLPEGLEAIGDGALSRTRIETLRIPASVERISPKAFRETDCLTTLLLDGQNSNYAVLDGALYSKDGVRLLFVPRSAAGDFSVPDGVAEIGDYAFGGCKRLERVAASDAIQRVGDGAFSGCVSLSEIRLSHPMAYIGARAFSMCVSLCDLDALRAERVGERAFENCISIYEANITSCVKSMGRGVFYGCTSLSSVTVGMGGVTNLPEETFYGCCSLERVSLPDGVTAIGDGAFYGCASLSDVTLPDDLESVGGAAFYGCASLDGVSLPPSVSSVGGAAFCGCDLFGMIRFEDVYSWQYRDKKEGWHDVSPNILEDYFEAYVFLAGDKGKYGLKKLKWKDAKGGKKPEEGEK